MQNYENHTRYYPLHHFVFYPLLTIAFGASAWLAMHDAENHFVWVAISVVFLFIAWLSLMMRQHYALGNQNRIVRLELRLRYYILTQRPFDPLERQLSNSQLYALRFASDQELVALIEKAIAQKLSPDNIKQEIKNWVPDHMRL